MTHKCTVCRREQAVYKVAGSVLGYRCARIASAEAAKHGHKLRMVLLPSERKRRAAIRKARRAAVRGRR